MEKFHTEDVCCFESMFASELKFNFQTNFLDIGLM